MVVRERMIFGNIFFVIISLRRIGILRACHEDQYEIIK